MPQRDIEELKPETWNCMKAEEKEVCLQGLFLEGRGYRGIPLNSKTFSK